MSVIMEATLCSFSKMMLVLGVLSLTSLEYADATKGDTSNSELFITPMNSPKYLLNNSNTTMPPAGVQRNFTDLELLLYAAFGEPMFQAALQIMRYCSPLLVILGIIGNTLSMLVVLQKKNRRISCCTYMTALAICDNGSLLTLGYYWWVTFITPIIWTRTHCVVWVYIVFIMTAGSGFLLVGVTLDRFLAVCYPFRARKWCTPSRARKIAAGILVYVVLHYIPMAAMSNVVDGNVCAAFRFDDWPKLNGTLAVVNLLAMPVIPFAVILTMNVKILLAVKKSGSLKGKEKRKSKGSVQPDNEDSETTESQSQRDKQLTVMLLTVSFAYLIIILPISCRVVAYIFVNPYASPKAYALFVLLFAALNHVLFLNNAINFYLYYITGSRFRRDLQKLFVHWIRKCPCKTAGYDFNMASVGSGGKRQETTTTSTGATPNSTSDAM